MCLSRTNWQKLSEKTAYYQFWPRFQFTDINSYNNHQHFNAPALFSNSGNDQHAIALKWQCNWKLKQSCRSMSVLRWSSWEDKKVTLSLIRESSLFVVVVLFFFFLKSSINSLWKQQRVLILFQYDYKLRLENCTYNFNFFSFSLREWVVHSPFVIFTLLTAGKRWGWQRRQQSGCCECQAADSGFSRYTRFSSLNNSKCYTSDNTMQSALLWI